MLYNLYYVDHIDDQGIRVGLVIADATYLRCTISVVTSENFSGMFWHANSCYCIDYKFEVQGKK
jgi:hypothetical protein